jgi:hypothetical protein
MAEKHEIYLATDAEGNASVGFGIEETLEAIGEYRSPPAHVVCLQLAMDTPTEDSNEDRVTVVDVVVPPEDPEAGDEAELPAESGAEAPAEVRAPADQPATQVAA